ncbi:peptidase A4 family-domain-containing protein [Xylariaceae sp. FL0255]|nr:peptidase A4 family-domain-containing protein [Xylariaceae sp. FL0255]
MKAAVAATLFANAALASPMMDWALKELSARHAARRSATFKSASGEEPDYTADSSESTNWAGIAQTPGSGVTEIEATFTVPQPSIPGGGDDSTSYCGAAWIGIDGYGNADLIQTGVLWCVQGSSYEYTAWYEYLPAALVAYDGISVTAGDVINVKTTKDSSNGGTCYLTANGQTVSNVFTANQSSPLPGATAEWIVEDFSSNGGLVPFANFGSVTFTDATAQINGATVNAGDGNPTNIGLESSSGSVITSTSVDGSSLTVTYTGP